MAQIAKFSNICLRCKALLNQFASQLVHTNKAYYVTSQIKLSRETGGVGDFTSDSGLPAEQLPSLEKQEESGIIRPSLPLITSRKLEYPNKYHLPRQAWLETLSSQEDEKLGIVDLHPDIFGVYPRVDILHHNIQWQQTYKRISYAKTKSRAELRGGGRKPWQQKGTGRARHGSSRSPIWIGGAKALGPRGPKSYFYMLPTNQRVLGLRVALSVKLAQNDLHIVDSLDIPTDEEKYLKELFDIRFWGFSALFVDDTDVMPENISVALSEVGHFNLMPVYGLNVYSMLKHETLVLTLAAVEKIEQKLLYQMHKKGESVKYNYNKRYSLAA